MKSFITTLGKIIKLDTERDGADANFDQNKKGLVIPLYQREYKWTTEQVETLLRDVNSRDKFLGLIILDEKNDENKTEHGLYVGGNSGFDSDDSPEHINSIYSDLGGEEMEGYESTVVADVTKSDKRVTKCIRVRKYTGQGIVVYWRFAVLFDKATGKMCLVSAYDKGKGDYLEPLLESVRFNP